MNKKNHWKGRGADKIKEKNESQYFAVVTITYSHPK